MLVLSRKPGESLLVGNIKFTILEVQGKKVKVGIDAPHDVNIVRSEILERGNNANSPPTITTD